MERPAARRRDRREDLLGASVYSSQAEPPYQGLARDLVYITYQIDPQRLRPFLPAALTISASNTVQLAVYKSAASWGIGPHSRLLFGVEVDDHDSPDTNKAMFIPVSVMNHAAIDLLEPRYGGSAVDGTVNVWREADLVCASAEVEGQTWMDIAIRPTGELTPNNSGVDRYIGAAMGGLVQHDIAFTATATEADLVRFEITADAPPTFQALRPIHFHFIGLNPEFAGTWSVPSLLTVNRNNATLSTHLTLMEREGRSAAAFRADGELLSANATAAALLQHMDKVRLKAAVLEAVSATGAQRAQPILLRQSDGRRPILAQLMAVRLPEIIEDVILAVLVDTEAAQFRNAQPLLRLLGLTGAEARLAELVGSGLSVRDTAEALLLSEHTVRSSLKSVYGKLGVSKQSELGRLIARLQFN